MDIGDTRRSQYSIETLKELMNKSTAVVNWYPYMEVSGATVRGPWHRWFRVDEVIQDHRHHVSSPIDDANYAAAAMNAVPHLIQRIEDLERELARYRVEIVINT